jgi:hypothetical protein
MKKIKHEKRYHAQIIIQKILLKSDDNSQKLNLKTRGMTRKVGQ